MIILSAPMTSRCPKQPVRCCKTPSDSLLSPPAIYKCSVQISEYAGSTYNAAQAMARVTPTALTRVPE